MKYATNGTHMKSARKDGLFTFIKRVSVTGQTFLGTFKDHAIPAEAAPNNSVTASQAAVLAKWKSAFEHMPKRAF
jgi:hypothetical protein